LLLLVYRTNSTLHPVILNFVDGLWFFLLGDAHPFTVNDVKLHSSLVIQRQ
jgi:hypothetical protein